MRAALAALKRWAACPRAGFVRLYVVTVDSDYCRQNHVFTELAEALAFEAQARADGRYGRVHEVKVTKVFRRR
jgi:hypothetical protein